MEEKLKGVIDKLTKATTTGYMIYVSSALQDLYSILDKNSSNSQEDTPLLCEEVSKFREITDSMAKTYEAKNHDYGNSFDQSLDEFGPVASVVRLGDKMNRIKSLIKKDAKVKNESIKDTLLDMANYAIMTIMWMDENNK